MKNTVFSSRETDGKILLLISTAAAIAVPVSFDCLQNPTGALIGKILNSVIGLGLGIFVWAGFRLLEPKRASQGWKLAKLVSIPTLWGLLFLGVIAWVHQVQAPYLGLMQKVYNLVIPPIA
jgi:hypothetical protein